MIDSASLNFTYLNKLGICFTQYDIASKACTKLICRLFLAILFHRATSHSMVLSGLVCTPYNFNNL